MRKAFLTVTVVGKIRNELLVNLPKLKQLFKICELSDGKTFWLKPIFSLVRTSIWNDRYKFNLNLCSGVGGGRKKTTPEMKEEAHSRNVKSSCSQPSLCVLHLHPTSGPDGPVSHKASYKNTVLPCPRTFCVSPFGSTESRRKSCLLRQRQASTTGLCLLHLCP